MLGDMIIVSSSETQSRVCPIMYPTFYLHIAVDLEIENSNRVEAFITYMRLPGAVGNTNPWFHYLSGISNCDYGYARKILDRSLWLYMDILPKVANRKGLLLPADCSDVALLLETVC